MTIIFECHNEDKQYFESQALSFPEEIDILTISRFDSESDFINAVLVLTSATLPFVTKIILEFSRSKKYYKIFYEGSEFTGLSEDNMIEILKTIIKEDNYDRHQ